MAKFCGYVMGMCMDIFMGIGKLCGYEISTHGKILLGIWFWFLENLCAYDFGNVRISLCMNLWEFFIVYGYGKNLVVVYRYVKNFDCGEILVGQWFFVVVGHWSWEYIFLGAWEFLDIRVLVMGIFGYVETLNETSLEFTWWGLVMLILLENLVLHLIQNTLQKQHGSISFMINNMHYVNFKI